LAVETLAPNKFLLGISNPEHVEKILNEGPWNVRGSFLLLRLWSPMLAIAEMELTHCPFWIQIHGLPRQNMMIKNAVMIGKGLGNLLNVDNLNSPGIVCRPFLRVQVGINTSKSLILGFNLPCEGRDPLCFRFRYEQLGDYCTLCGLIGHKRLGCPQPESPFPLAKYSLPLYALPSNGPRMVFPHAKDDSDSRVSSDGQAQSRSKVNSSFSYGESTRLQLVPFQRELLVPHVSQPLDDSMEISQSNTRVVGSFPLHSKSISQALGISDHAMSASFSIIPDNQSISSVSSVRDKGKAPMIDTCPTTQVKHHYYLQVAEYSSCYPHNTPFVLDSLITNIQEISKGHNLDFPILESPNLKHLARFMDFLSTWAHTPSPPLPTHGPKPFQIHPPSDSFLLGQNPHLPSPPNQDHAKGPSLISSSFIPSQIAHLDKVVDHRPKPFQITSPIPPTSAGSNKPNPYKSSSPNKLTRFHPYYTRSQSLSSPPPVKPPSTLPVSLKRPLIDLDELPLFELKKQKASKPTKMEMVALSFTALQYSMDVPTRCYGSVPPSIKVPPAQSTVATEPIHSPYGVPPTSMEVDMVASLSPIRKYYRSNRGTRLFNQGLSKAPDSNICGSNIVEKGETQSGSSPQK